MGAADEAGTALALDGSAAGTALTDVALSMGGAAGNGVALGRADATGSGWGAAGSGVAGSGARAGAGAGAGAGTGTGTGVGGVAEEAAGAATGRAETIAAAEGNTLAGTTCPAAAEALAAGCACTRATLDRPTAKQSPKRRNQSPQTRADVNELTEDLTLGHGASVTSLVTASTIRVPARSACSPRKPPPNAHIVSWKPLPKAR